MLLRCQRLLIQLMRFKPNAEYVPGKERVVADTLSRNPLSVSSETSETEEDVRAEMLRLVSTTSSDPQLSRVFDCTVNGWPKYAKHVPQELRPYHVVADVKII